MNSKNVIKTGNRSYEILDLTKFILAFFVVAIHTLPLANCNVTIVNNAYNSVIFCAVPIFFLSSGYLLMNKIMNNDSSDVSECLNTVLGPYIKKIIKLYLIWNIVYLPFAIYIYVVEKNTVLGAVANYLKGFFLIGEHYDSWALWYLLSTVYALFFVLILNKLGLGIKKIAIIGFVAFLIGCFINAFAAYQGNLPNALLFIKKAISYTIVNGRLLRGFFYLPAGMALREKELGKKVSVVFIVAGFLAGVFGQYTVNLISEVAIAFFSLGLFGLLIGIRLKPSGVYFHLRKMSTVIYFIHLLVFGIFEILIWHEKRFGLITFLIVSAISLIIAFIYTQIRYGKRKRAD
jgi:surface polysaccharide O-acyltransferase-like enzyme